MKLHRHITDAEDCGYELNILERVSKPLPSTKVIKKKHGTGSGYATSGNSSASESGQNPRRLKMQEQAVDELLQMKMLESIVDTEVSGLCAFLYWIFYSLEGGCLQQRADG